jgi:hypothetical protein
MMDGLDQVQRASWYRDDLRLSNDATFEIVSTKPLQVQLSDSKGRKSQSVRSLYFYASNGQYTAIFTQDLHLN